MLRLGDRLLTTLPLLLPAGLYVRFSRCRSALSYSAASRAALSSILPGGCFFPFRRGFFGPPLTFSTARSVGRAANAVNGPIKPTARLRTTPGSPGSPRRSRDHSFPLPHPDGTGCCSSPRLLGRLHRRCRYCVVEEALRVWWTLRSLP
jgi:hypothetical protein